MVWTPNQGFISGLLKPQEPTKAPYRPPSKRTVGGTPPPVIIHKKPDKRTGGFNWNPLGSRLPETPADVLGLSNPIAGGVGGVISIPSRYVAPIIGTGLGLGIGALLFGGGGQEQTMEVTPTVTPTQTLDTNPIQELLNKILANQTINQDIPVSVGGGSTYQDVSGYIASPITQTETTNITENIIYEIQQTFTNASQSTTTTTTSGQTAEQGLDILKLALIGVAGFIAMEVIKK